MKIKVNRSLTGGKYNISFDVSDFTPEELDKMDKFGIPTVVLERSVGGGSQRLNVRINQIGPLISTYFGQEEEARSYEADVKDQLLSAIEEVRARNDTYTSSDEVEL